MALSPVTSNSLAADSKSLNALKLQAAQDTPAAVKETAKQLESLFMRELIKSMREATAKSGLMDSNAGDLSTDLLDQQLSVTMSGQPGGLSAAIERQLSQQIIRSDGTTVGGIGKVSAAPVPATTAASTPATPASTAQTHFVQRHNEAATNIEKTSGIPASFMLGQAGHETGWGRAEIRNKDGSPSFNLFGIKAGAGWTGKTTSVTTTEYVHGEARKVTAKFRAYDSYEDSFKDYARLINESPRYADAREKTSSSLAYATELKRAGYATDPNYASKLSRAIDRTEQLRRAYA